MEMERLKRINAKGANYLKSESEAAKKAKLNKNFQEIAKDSTKAPATMKGKSRVPVEASMVNDAEGLKDQIKAL